MKASSESRGRASLPLEKVQREKEPSGNVISSCTGYGIVLACYIAHKYDAHTNTQSSTSIYFSALKHALSASQRHITTQQIFSYLNSKQEGDHKPITQNNFNKGFQHTNKANYIPLHTCKHVKNIPYRIEC